MFSGSCNLVCHNVVHDDAACYPHDARTKHRHGVRCLPVIRFSDATTEP